LYRYRVAEMKRLGERIRRKRESLQMQLSELSRRVGVTPSALSQIENAKAFPSIVTLKSIAESLYTTVGELIGENETLNNNPLIRSGEKKFVKTNASGTRQYLLSHHDQLKQMETYLLEFKPGADSEDFFQEHPGQEFCYLLKGEILVTLEDKTFRMMAGDSLYYNSARFHKARNDGSEQAELLWITTP
jgi:transcriptional regulator with XRE-family HTH domain